MKASAVFVERNGGLFPVDEAGQEVVRHVKKKWDGCLVKVHIPRRIKQHRLLFALINEVIEAGVWEGNSDTLLTWIKIATGHVETMIGPKGQTVYVPKSISFASMPQNEFAPFFDAAIRAVCERLLQGSSEQELRQHIEQVVDGGYSQMRREYA